MSYFIPIAFLPVDTNEIPENPNDWISIRELLEKKSDDFEASGLRTSSSRNSWHQQAIEIICEHLQIDELSFIQDEIAWLSEEQIQTALHAIEKFFAVCQNGIPQLAPEMEKEPSIWSLRYYYDEKHNVKSFSAEQIRRAFSESEAVYENKDVAEIGYNAVVTFFSFLKAIQATLQECLKLKKYFLYVQYSS
jgi:hypothetical protein